MDQNSGKYFIIGVTPETKPHRVVRIGGSFLDPSDNVNYTTLHHMDSGKDLRMKTHHVNILLTPSELFSRGIAHISHVPVVIEIKEDVPQALVGVQTDKCD